MRTLALTLLALLPACVGASRPVADAGLQVVKVQVTESDGAVWLGSAVPIQCERLGPGVYVAIYVTASHVIGKDPSSRIRLQMFRRPDYWTPVSSHEVILRERHPDYDLGLLAIQLPHPVQVLEVADRLPIVGEKVLLAGYSLGLSLSLSEGLVASEIRLRDYPQWPSYHHTAYARGGASGGAVIDQKGKLLGIHVAGYGGTEHQGLFIPLQPVRGWLATYAGLFEHGAPNPFQ